MRSKYVLRMLTLRGFALFHDVTMAAFAFSLSLVLRLGLNGFLALRKDYIFASLLFSGLVGLIGFAFGMNRGVWRYASLSDLTAIVKTATMAIMAFVIANFLLVRLEDIPRSTVIIAWAFTILLLTIPRAAYRLYRNKRDLSRSSADGQIPRKRVILVGANDNADVFIKTIGERTGAPFEVVAIIDERKRRTGRVIRGIPVLGGPEKIPDLVRRLESRRRRPEAIILTRSRREYEEFASIQELIEIAAHLQLQMLRLPNLLDLTSINSDLNVSPIKLEDLLHRPTIQHETPGMADLIRDKVVLVTGAGGSIGSELSRQIHQFGPARLILTDASEYLLYTIDSELAQSNSSVPVKSLLCNVRERNTIRDIILSEKPFIVCHAAALKHVPIVEVQPLEGIFTNAIGTRNVADACLAAKVTAMIMISTDKAVNPSNVMGATKRMAEMYCQSLDVQSDDSGTRFVTVRFGNVLGSAGSVVPLFEKQIRSGGPITVTHPEIERFFMVIPEACLLVLQAAGHALTRRSEVGRIFVLDMGKPVKIVDLARNLIRLSGLKPEIDIKIVYTGLRPGEKLYEEMFALQEALRQTEIPAILSAFPRPTDQAMIARIFDEMERLIQTKNLQGALRLLQSTVADFQPSNQISRMIAGTSGLHVGGGPPSDRHLMT